MESIVYFDEDTGNLTSVSNVINDSPDPYIVVHYSDVEKILTGHETMNRYRVVLCESTNEYVLESWFDKKLAILSWDEHMYKIPKYESLPMEEHDIVVIQNTKTNKWIFKINWNVFHVLSRSSKRIGQYSEFYITRSNDANVLLHTIRFNTDFIDSNGETEIDGVDFDQPISVYCRKIFNSYAHIQI